MKNIYKNSPENLNKAKKILKKNNIIAVQLKLFMDWQEIVTPILLLKKYIDSKKDLKKIP